MNDFVKIPHCPHCNAPLKKWLPPENSTWEASFMWVCFNDECTYFVNGWEHLQKTQNVTASYRYRLDPQTGASGPLPAWSKDAHKDQILDN